MPNVVIVICSVLGLALLLASYIRRFVGFRRRNYDMNPLSPLAWIVTSLVAVIFLLISRNFVLVSLNVAALVLQIITLVWCVKIMRSEKSRKWQVKSEDFVCFALVVLAAAAYQLTGDLTIGAAILFVGSICGELPQLRKDYQSPRTDQVAIYLITVMRYAFLTGTLQRFDFAGLSLSLFWGIFTLLEAGWVIYCQNRQKLNSRKKLWRMLTCPRKISRAMIFAKSSR